MALRNTPAALRWLADRRARLAFDLTKLEKIVEESSRRLSDLRLDLAGLDRALTVFDPSINAELIQDIHGHAPRRRGALRDSMMKALQGQSPEWTSTDIIELMVVTDLAITFPLESERKRWYENVFRAQLRKFVRDGQVERLQDPAVATSEIGRWRWKSGL